MVSQIRPVFILILGFTLLTGLAIPLAFVGLGQVAFPFQAGGSLVQRDGRIFGSALIGQSFTSDKYFHARPSALMGTDPKDSSKQVPTPYDASESGASNLAPASKALSERVAADITKIGATDVPADMVTTSASGLDPDISPENAALQVDRVAKARGVPPDAVRALVTSHMAAPELGFVGAPRVNVLALNLALDEAAGRK